MNLYRRFFPKKGLNLSPNDVEAISIIQKIVQKIINNRFRQPVRRDASEHAARDLVFAAINERAKKVAASKLNVYQQNANGKELVDTEHWAHKLLNSPNDYIEAAALFMYMLRAIDINGNAYFHTPVSPKLGYPVAMWPLPPSMVTVVANKEQYGGLVSEYIINDGGLQYRVPEKEMLHIKTLLIDNNIKSLFLGKGLVEAIINNADVDVEITDYLARWFANDLNKEIIFKTETQAPEDWDVLKEKWNRQNPRMKVTSILEGGLGIADVQQNALQVNFESLDARTTKVILSVFGVTLGLLTGDFTNRATAEVQEGRFLTNTINPLLVIFGQAFTRHLAKFDSSLIVEYTPWQADDSNDKRLQEVHDISYGVRTVNDVRRERGYEEIPEGDTVLLAANLVPFQTILSGATPKNPTATTPTLTPPAKAIKALATDAKYNFWKKYADPTQKISDSLKSQIAEVFDGIEKEVLSNTRNYETKDFDLFNVEKWKKALQTVTGGLLEQHILDTIVLSLKDVDLTSDSLSDGFSQSVSDMLRESTAKITDSIGTIRDELTKILENNPLASSDDMKALLQEKFSTLKESRANAIAQTSSNYATNAAQTKTWGDVGFEVSWLTQRDGKVRESHAKADGQLRKDGKFQVGADTMEHPCGGSKAEENVNCRCVCFPVKT